jgi:hypothetical protein
MENKKPLAHVIFPITFYRFYRLYVILKDRTICFGVRVTDLRFSFVSEFIVLHVSVHTKRLGVRMRTRSSMAISNRNYNVASSQLCFIIFQIHHSAALRPLKTISFTSYSPCLVYTRVIAALCIPYIIVYLYVNCNSFDLLISFC